MSTLIQLTEYLHAISRAVKKLICCHMLLGSEEETVRFHGSFSPPLPQKVWGEFFPKKKSFLGDFLDKFMEGGKFEIY